MTDKGRKSYTFYCIFFCFRCKVSIFCSDIRNIKLRPKLLLFGKTKKNCVSLVFSPAYS